MHKYVETLKICKASAEVACVETMSQYESLIKKKKDIKTPLNPKKEWQH